MVFFKLADRDHEIQDVIRLDARIVGANLMHNLAQRVELRNVLLKVNFEVATVLHFRILILDFHCQLRPHDFVIEEFGVDSLKNGLLRLEELFDVLLLFLLWAQRF